MPSFLVLHIIFLGHTVIICFAMSDDTYISYANVWNKTRKNRLVELYMHFLYIKICHTFTIEICMDYFFLLASKYHYLSMGSSVIHSDWSYIHTTITCGLIWLETLLKEKKETQKSCHRQILITKPKERSILF